MALNAFLAIGKLSVANIAAKFGQRKLIEHPRIGQATSELEEYSLIVG